MSNRPLRRRAVIALAATVVTVTGLAAGMASMTTASASTITGAPYVDPNSAVAKWLAANPGDSRAAVIKSNVASQPAAHWISNFNIATVGTDVSTVIAGAATANQVPVISIYGIPNRDCGGASAGGATDLTSYQTWISTIAGKLGTQPVIIILETDSLALQTCLGGSDVQARDQALSTAVQTLKAGNPAAKVYLDGGHSAWNSASTQASRLAAAGVTYADGFFTNASNFNPTSAEASYGKAIIAALTGQGITGKHQIIDTSRNGGAAGSWCADNATDRRIGTYPTLNTGDPDIDGYLWIKPPGEADGCSFQAGSFQPALAYSLANGVAAPSGS